MLNNRKETKFKPTTFAKKATHGIQTATIRMVELNQDRNENNYLSVYFDCETGEYVHRFQKPYRSDYFPYGYEENFETLDTIFWENCDKAVDELYKLIKLFDVSPIDADGFITDNFATEYRIFIDNLKSGYVTVSDNNYKEFGFVKARRKQQKVSVKTGNGYTSYDFRIVGNEKDTWAENTNDPKYAYADMIGERIGDYTNIEFWNAFFEFVFNYFLALRKNEFLNKEIVVKLIRIESPEYEKDEFGKFIKIDDKKVIKTIYYNVGVPQSQWYKSVENQKFEMKFSKAELEVIAKYVAIKDSADNGSEISTTSTNGNDFPF